MSAREVLERVEAELGAGALERHEPLEVDAVPVCATLCPEDGAGLARGLGAIARCGAAALPRGGGTHLDLGNLPVRADLLLSTRRLCDVDEFEPAEGVCHARAGTPLRALREAVSAEGWELPLDVPDADATLGGAIASAAVGPRTQAYGLPRDIVLGLEVVLATGARTRCGGRVVKFFNDTATTEIYTGSLGSLGVIEGAWLRLRPAPECARVLEAPPAPIDVACARGLDAARRSAVRACALSTAGDAALRCTVELAGDALSVERDAAYLADALAAETAPDAALDAVLHLQRDPPGPRGLRFRLAALPDRLAACAAHLAAAGGRLLIYPGLNLLYVTFALEDGADRAGADRLFHLVAELARASAGELVCEAAPPAAKRERDVFGTDPAALPLLRALKAHFDPDGVLSPGRFAGRL
jgi:glycolate oxidase FAD binding subunit